MVDIAHLGLAVDSAPVERGSRSLDGLTGAAQRAETAVDGFNATTGQVATRMNVATSAVKANSAALEINAAAARRTSHLSRNLSFQLIDIGQALTTLPTSGVYALQNLGFQIAQIGQLYMGQGGMRAALRDMIGQVGTFAGKFGPAIAITAALAATIGGMTYEINKASDVTVSFGDTALATWQVISEGVHSVLQPAINAIAPWMASAWAQVVSIFKTVNNALIAGWVTAFDAIKIVWNAFPAVMEDIATRAGNLWLAGIERSINLALKLVKDFYRTLNPVAKLADAFGNDTISGIFGTGALPEAISIGRLTNRSEGAAGRAGADIMQTARGNFSRDWLGQFFDAVEVKAIANALAELDANAEKAGNSMKSAADKAHDPWAKLRKVTDQMLEKMRDAAKGLGQGLGGIFEGLLNKTMTWKDAALSALRSVLQYLNQMNVAQGGRGLFGGGFLQGLLGGLLGIGFANGGVFRGGNVIPFANGGVVGQPTLFPMARGAGLMGEAGPEAIMPLRRGPNGRLGVEAANSNQRVQVDVRAYVDDNGNWQAEVERVARPIAQTEANSAAGQVASAVPSMALNAVSENRTRHIRPRSAL